MAGNSVSHAHNVNKRRFLPNLQSVRVQTPQGNRKMKVCTCCIQAGKITKSTKYRPAMTSAV